ncbi:hypothetical protein L861_19285 [Litchfieldella anticariensis FP35 = DSM 16096]|uniref:HTH tetR-type domain-containing protein n=1 Tax=Litchfieldella anticariensis (strain DSM 16096 / CECT 5854 / CIP 108499 / LMG 22089 / FP35) TaxID=1121939 RepID=S2L790_LITA3|nr:TetR/AcrR family transcriptional regulator [Halomonas anticariensis]EPC03679.1 hypothetical protein L861_19285 [Halomonas anticariensis FP35 = DSM 16096]
MAMTPVYRHDGAGHFEPLADRILEATLQQADEYGWDAVRLTEVAAQLDIPATTVLDHYRDLDAVANVWFLRGWRAMLADKPDDFDTWRARERIEYCMLAWFDALAAHRRVTVQMLRTKAHLPHLHTWGPMIFDLSRTIQWLREAARLEAPYGTRRARMEEVGLTALFLDTLRIWSRDDTPRQQDTRHFLAKRLKRGDRLMRWVWGRCLDRRQGAADHETSQIITDKP